MYYSLDSRNELFFELVSKTRSNLVGLGRYKMIFF